MESIKNLLALFIVIILVGVCSVAVYTVLDELIAQTSYAGDNSGTLDTVLDEFVTGITTIFAIFLVGFFLFFIIKKRKPKPPLWYEDIPETQEEWRLR